MLLQIVTKWGTFMTNWAKNTILAVLTLSLGACAASPAVLKEQYGNELQMSCAQLQDQMRRAKNHEELAAKEDGFQLRYMMPMTAVMSIYNINKAKSAAQKRHQYLIRLAQQRRCNTYNATMQQAAYQQQPNSTSMMQMQQPQQGMMPPMANGSSAISPLSPAAPALPNVPLTGMAGGEMSPQAMPMGGMMPMPQGMPQMMPAGMGMGGMMDMPQMPGNMPMPGMPMMDSMGMGEPMGDMPIYGQGANF